MNILRFSLLLLVVLCASSLRAQTKPDRDYLVYVLSEGADKISGIEKRGENDGPKLIGVRAPKLDRPMPKAWNAPRPIFNGKDLTGWEPIGNVNNNKWVARNGELVNDNPPVEGQRGPGAANLKSTEKFQDFKTWDEAEPPKGTLSHYPNRNNHQILSVAAAPAPHKIAVQIYVQGLMTKMAVRHYQGEAMEKTLAWAESELEGFMRS